MLMLLGKREVDTMGGGWWLVAHSCPTLCDPMDYRAPGFSVLHYLSQFAHLMALSRWCHPTISSSVAPLSSCPQSFPASGSFPMTQFFASGGQSIGASASVLPMNVQDWFPLGLTGLISSLSKGLPRVFSSTVQKASILWCSAIFMVQLSHPYMTTGKTIALTRRTFVGKVMSLLLNMPSRLVILFLPRSKCLLISWLQLSSAVILEPKKIKSVTVSIFSLSLCHNVMGLESMPPGGGWEENKEQDYLQNI